MPDRPAGSDVPLMLDGNLLDITIDGVIIAVDTMNAIPDDFLSKSMRVEALVLTNLRCASHHLRTIASEELLFDLERFSIVQRELLAAQQELLDARVRPEIARRARREYDRALLHEIARVPQCPPRQFSTKSVQTHGTSRPREDRQNLDTASQTDSNM